MPLIKFKKPPIQYSSSGAMSVSSSDILQSEKGQAEIQEAAKVAIALHLRKPSPITEQQANPKL